LFAPYDDVDDDDVDYNASTSMTSMILTMAVWGGWVGFRVPACADTLARTPLGVLQCFIYFLFWEGGGGGGWWLMEIYESKKRGLMAK
jgi:hypothetical protein